MGRSRWPAQWTLVHCAGATAQRVLGALAGEMAAIIGCRSAPNHLAVEGEESALDGKPSTLRHDEPLPIAPRRLGRARHIDASYLALGPAGVNLHENRARDRTWTLVTFVDGLPHGAALLGLIERDGRQAVESAPLGAGDRRA